jgi:enoyl-CoA hydratase
MAAGILDLGRAWQRAPTAIATEEPVIPDRAPDTTTVRELVRTTPTPWGVRLVLDRPEKLNALSGGLVAELVAAIDVAEADPDVRVVVLQGAGRAFCSGYDLTEEAEGGIGGPVAWRTLLAADVAATLRLLDCAKPVIAQVHGYALAGGLELAMACDLIVAAEGTKLGEPEIRYGSAPVALLMPYLIGQKRTRELLLTGDLIDAVEAERIGLVNRVVPADRLDAEVDALADRLARTPPEVMGPTKRMLNRAMDAAGFREAVQAGIDLGAIINAADTPEQREWDAIVRRDGLKAALAWRDARYDERLAESGRGTPDEARRTD